MDNNVILHGIEDQVWEIKEVTRKKALLAISHIANGKTPKEKLDVVRKIGFKDIRRIGDYKANRSRPVLERKISADFLLQNKKKLPKGIYADKEYSAEIENERHKLQPILRRAKQLPEYKTKSKLEGGNLIIKGHSYNSKTLHLLPELLTGYNVFSKIGDDCIGFFGELNPLLNFHPAPFFVQGINFSSSEQFIQYQKAKLFSDDDHAKKILESKSALECKILSKEIPNYDLTEWHEKAGPLCEAGLIAKFMQNDSLLKLLIATGTKTLVECTYDKLWGNGIPLQNEDCLDVSKWSGGNILGRMLMQIRSRNSVINSNNTESTMDT